MVEFFEEIGEINLQSSQKEEICRILSLTQNEENSTIGISSYFERYKELFTWRGLVADQYSRNVLSHVIKVYIYIYIYIYRSGSYVGTM